MANEKRPQPSGGLAVAGVVGLAVLCCAGPLVLGTLGVGTVLAA